LKLFGQFSSSHHLPTQLSQVLQWTARGGRKMRHVAQYFSFITTPLIRTSRTRGGGYSSLATFIISDTQQNIHLLTIIHIQCRAASSEV